MSTSKKYKNFISEPIGDKNCSEIPGIGVTLSYRLDINGYKKAYMLLGQFLLLHKREDWFRNWLEDFYGANSFQSKNTYDALNYWCINYI